MRALKLVSVLILILVVVLAGCSQSQAPARPTAQPTAKPTTPPTTKPTSTPSSGTSPSAINVPVYGNSKMYSAPTFYYQILGIPTEGVSVEVYYVENAKVKDILNWYKEKLSDYEIVQDMAVATVSTPQGSAEWGGILFKKGDEAVGIWAISGTAVEGGKGTVYYIVKGPVDKLAGSAEYEAEQLPSSDQASGEEPIKRYPGAVMINYYKDTSNPLKLSIGIDYGTKDDAAKVAEWYKQELQANGWALEEESADDTAYSLTFGKDSEYLDIVIIKSTETTAYTEIDLSYTKKGLPSQDIVSGEEPIKRYPGAVMIEHSITTYGGAKMIAISYGTNDDAKNVFSWYEGELKSSGWQVMSGSSGGEFTIYASKGGAVIELEISKNAYTEIHLAYTAQ
ncbi:MAG: hypothetical protein H0Z28_03720 [Archaeoglobus sp.]|nr:hypothetical protein [Archaeoglobus sp.]